MGQRSHQERIWRTLENDKQQMDSRQTRNSSGFDPNPAMPQEGARIQREPSKTSNKSEALLDAQVATPSKTTKWRKPIEIEYELKNVSESLHKGQKDWTEEVR